jgi:hypothetical protein
MFEDKEMKAQSSKTFAAKTRTFVTISPHPAKIFLALLFVIVLALGDVMVLARSKPVNALGQDQQQDAPKIPNDQLDSLVAPIALYPDPLLTRRWWLLLIRSDSFSCSNGWISTRISRIRS